MKTGKFLITITTALTLLFLSATVQAGMTSELVNTLVNQLGVTENQAAGGAGAIFRSAKEKLAPEEFKKIESAVPEAESLIEAAPQITGEKSSGGWGSALTSIAKEANPDVGAAAELAQSFDKLGLEKQMIGKFGNIISDYCKEKGGEIVQGLIQKALPI